MTNKNWRVPAALIVLSVVPLVAGAVRLTELVGGAEVTPANARFFAAPVPVVLHICCAALYCILGAFQFLRRKGGRHGVAGRVLVPAGILAGLSGLWMTFFYARPAGDGDLLAGFRLVFGSAMVLAICAGLAAIRRRDFAGHRAWMIRAYAIGQGAGTQVLVLLPPMLMFGALGEIPRALLMGAAWVINIVVAEWVIRS